MNRPERTALQVVRTMDYLRETENSVYRVVLVPLVEGHG